MGSNSTDTITFLFTDIEGSTRLWEQHDSVMQDALALHDNLVQDAIVRHDGRVFKALGDGFCAVFAEPTQAILAAHAIQNTLAAQVWVGVPTIRVRVALHTGAAYERNGDYFGPTLNRVARLRDAGHGGQILLSEATQLLVHNHLPSGLSIRDLGESHLRDLINPERIFQLTGPDMLMRFPPLRIDPPAAIYSRIHRKAVQRVGIKEIHHSSYPVMQLCSLETYHCRDHGHAQVKRQARSPITRRIVWHSVEKCVVAA